MKKSKADPLLQVRKSLARRIYPLYKAAQLQSIAADAGVELRWLLYFLKTSRPGPLYRSVSPSRLLSTLNHLSDYYEQGKQFYVGSKKLFVDGEWRRPTGTRVRIIHPPKDNINFLNDLSTHRYSPTAYKHQVVS